MYRVVRAASGEEDTRFDDGMDLLKDDFNYLVETFDKMNRDGDKERAIEMMAQMHQSINDMTSAAVQEVSE